MRSPGFRRPPWATPGGGVDEGESDAEALSRELREEVGLAELDLGPLVWTRHHWHVDPTRWGGQTERVYLVRVDAFDLAPSFSEAELAAEGVHEARWFTLDELATVVTGPARLGELVRGLIADGPPAEPLDAGR